MSGNVLIAAPVHPVLTDGLSGAGYTIIAPSVVSNTSVAPLLRDVVGIITSTRLQLDRELLDVAPLLRWIGRMGSGLEVIDLAYAAARGIDVFASPQGNANAVAEHALGMLLSLMGKIDQSFLEIKSSIWRREENRGTEIEGKTIGIIGYGHTGRAFAKLLQGFDANILAYDKEHKSSLYPNVRMVDSLHPIYQTADIISFHVPITKETRYYLNNDFITMMQRPFIVLNTSRGAVVDSMELMDGLDTKKILGACLDVWEEEPPFADGAHLADAYRRLAGESNVILTPHIAGYTSEALFKMSEILLMNVLKI